MCSEDSGFYVRLCLAVIIHRSSGFFLPGCEKATSFALSPLQTTPRTVPLQHIPLALYGLEFHASQIIRSYCSIEAALVIGRVEPRAFSAPVSVVLFQRFKPQVLEDIVR